MTSETTATDTAREHGTDGAAGDDARPPRLTRHPTDRVVAGLAGGLGAYFNVDPVVFRILFVVLFFAGGSGLLLYLIGWLVVPEGDTDGRQRARAPGVGLDGRAGTAVGIALIVIAGVLLLDDVLPIRRVSVWPFALIGVGAFLLWQGRGDGGDGPSSPPSSGSGGAGTSAAAPSGHEERAPALRAGSGGGPGGRTGAPRARGPAPAARERRSHSVLGRVTVGLALLLTGVAAFLDTIGVLDVSPVQYMALVLTTLGLGLVVGAWWGRARWLAIPALLLLPALALASLAPFPLRGGVGDRSYVPQSVADLDPGGYELLAGQMRLDLTDIDLGDDESIAVGASVGFGELDVVVPADAAIEVETDVGAGQVTLLDRRSDGLGVDLRVEQPGTRGRVVLDLEVGFGEIRVTRSSAAPQLER